MTEKVFHEPRMTISDERFSNCLQLCFAQALQLA